MVLQGGIFLADQTVDEFQEARAYSQRRALAKEVAGCMVSNPKRLSEGELSLGEDLYSLLLFWDWPVRHPNERSCGSNTIESKWYDSLLPAE